MGNETTQLRKDWIWGLDTLADGMSTNARSAREYMESLSTTIEGLRALILILHRMDRANPRECIGFPGGIDDIITQCAQFHPVKTVMHSFGLYYTGRGPELMLTPTPGIAALRRGILGSVKPDIYTRLLSISKKAPKDKLRFYLLLATRADSEVLKTHDSGGGTILSTRSGIRIPFSNLVRWMRYDWVLDCRVKEAQSALKDVAMGSFVETGETFVKLGALEKSIEFDVDDVLIYTSQDWLKIERGEV